MENACGAGLFKLCAFLGQPSTDILPVHIYEKLYLQINILVLLDSLVTRNQGLQGLQSKWQAPKVKRQALFFRVLPQKTNKNKKIGLGTSLWELAIWFVALVALDLFPAEIFRQGINALNF